MVYNIPKGHNFNESAADILENLIKRIGKKRDKICIALSGGSTPIPILEVLQVRNLDWNRLYFFMVDERTVALDHQDSNYGAICNAFLNNIPSQSFSMLKRNYSIEKSIEAYEADLKRMIDLNETGFPVFDLILLGMGNDGHTASLFPGTRALKEEKKIVIKNKVPELDTLRITLTYPTILSAKHIVTIIKGEAKRKIYEELVSKDQTNYPMQKIVSKRNDLGWIIEG